MKNKKGLIEQLSHLFWEYDLKDIDPVKDRHLILKKVLSYGNIEDLKKIRRAFGDKAIKDFLISTQGKGIDKRRLRFYEVIFNLPHKEVNKWLKAPLRKIWDERCKR